MPIPSVNLKTTKELIQKVLEDIEAFKNKTPGQPEWKLSYDIEHDKNIDENIRHLVLSLDSPPPHGTAQEMLDYYTIALKTIEKEGVAPEKVLFSLGEISVLVTPANNMTSEEYYKEVVFNKGQLMSYQKENARGVEKLNKAHESYIQDLDEDTKKKLDVIHTEKLKPFKEIDDLLSQTISKVVDEEMKYKPAKKIKAK